MLAGVRRVAVSVSGSAATELLQVVSLRPVQRFAVGVVAADKHLGAPSEDINVWPMKESVNVNHPGSFWESEQKFADDPGGLFMGCM